MLLIAVGFGVHTDPFTCSVIADRSNVNPDKVEDCLQEIQLGQFPDSTVSTVRSWVDEILVVENDVVINNFDSDDGLGSEKVELSASETAQETEDELSREYNDSAEESDESDSEDA